MGPWVGPRYFKLLSRETCMIKRRVILYMYERNPGLLPCKPQSIIQALGPVYCSKKSVKISLEKETENLDPAQTSNSKEAFEPHALKEKIAVFMTSEPELPFLTIFFSIGSRT